MKFLIKMSVLILGAIIFVSCLLKEDRNDSLSSPERIDEANSSKKPIFDFRSFDPHFPVPPTLQETFVLRQDYPATYNSKETFPWANIDFKVNPVQYMQAVLNYCLEGNTEVDFRVQKNKIRNWYHAPWLHDDGQNAGNGREYLQGLTRERASLPGEIHHKQDVKLENWAIGFYNEPGGYTLGKIWADPTKPDPLQSNFPEGTVAFKLLFTDGTVDKVPFLADTKEWTANIYPCDPRTKPSPNCLEPEKRINRIVRLLQIDIAVKNSDANETGWVFGTFIYDASQKGNNVWEKMAPVGLSWGDDFPINSRIKDNGAFRNLELKQTYLNEELIVKDMPSTNAAYMVHHGLGGRLNGPIDNPISSCISCHARAAVTQEGEPMAFFSRLSRPTFTIPEFNKFFSTIKSGANVIQMGSKTFITTDYSLQISAGIRNYYRSIEKGRKKSTNANSPIREDDTALPLVTRGEE